MHGTPDTTFTRLLATHQVLAADGAMGTSLFALGLENGESPELLNVERPEMVLEAHAGFVAAGADIILTNTFGGNRRRLALHGLEHRVAELNAAGVGVARDAAATTDRPVAIAGSIGPTGDLLVPLGPLSPDDARDVFREQAEALADAGVDVLWIETMSSTEELDAALEACDGLGLPVTATMSFDTNGKTMMGVSPDHLTDVAGAVAVGANCGVGLGDVARAVAEITLADPNAIVVAKANAGIPAYTKEGGLTYPAGPLDMGAYATLAIRSGARIVGACCGSTPSHLAEIRRVIDTGVTGDRPSFDEIHRRLGGTPTEQPAAHSTRPARRRRRAS